MATQTLTTSSDISLPLTTPSSTIPTHGKLRYIKRGIIPTASPHLYHLPPLAEFGDVRNLPITNIKSSLDLGDSSPYTIPTHGFTARRYPSSMSMRSSWNDSTQLKNIYIPEVEALLKHVTGARTVMTESALIRSCVHTEIDGLAASEDPTADTEEDPWPKMIGLGVHEGASPAPKVHLDFSPRGARMHLRQYHAKLAEAGCAVIAAEDEIMAASEEEWREKYEGPRWAMFSVWRPLKRVTRDPLAFADRRSFPKADYVPVKLVEPTGKGLSCVSPSDTDVLKNRDVQNLSVESVHETETYLAYGSDKHEWCWIWDMTPDEVILIQLFDSEADKRGECGVMHSSVDVPGTEHHEARESIEVRCTAFW